MSLPKHVIEKLRDPYWIARWQKSDVRWAAWVAAAEKENKPAADAKQKNRK